LGRCSDPGTSCGSVSPGCVSRASRYYYLGISKAVFIFQAFPPPKVGGPVSPYWWDRPEKEPESKSSRLFFTFGGCQWRSLQCSTLKSFPRCEKLRGVLIRAPYRQNIELGSVNSASYTEFLGGSASRPPVRCGLPVASSCPCELRTIIYRGSTGAVMGANIVREFFTCVCSR